MKKSKKSTVTRKNPTGQVPKPEGHQDGHKKKWMTKAFKNYSK